MQVLLVTGATGVMMALYVVPVVNHLLLYFGKYDCNPFVIIAVWHSNVIHMHKMHTWCGDFL